MYEIVYEEHAAEDLAAVRAFARKRILDVVDEQLAHEPTHATRNRKPLFGLQAPWDGLEPIWELRIGEFRVFL